MKIAAVCPTYKRPRLLGRLIHCFLLQTHKDSELVILDDAGQYKDQEGERWRLISTGTRYRTFGDKRNALIRLISPDVEGIICFDDDDVYWPHAIESVSRALESKPWAQPRTVYETDGFDRRPNVDSISLQRSGKLRRFNTYSTTNPVEIAYGGSWAWRVDAFWSIGGYGSVNDNDDVWVSFRLQRKYGPSADSSVGCEPWYWYNRDPGVTHINDQRGCDFWAVRGKWKSEHVDRLEIGWNGPDVHGFPVVPGVHPRKW